MATTAIHINACDNELLLIASTPAGSSTLCHLKAGDNEKVRYPVDPRTILAKGVYELRMVGLNWGGPAHFEVTVTTDGQSETFGYNGDDPFWFDMTRISI